MFRLVIGFFEPEKSVLNISAFRTKISDLNSPLIDGKFSSEFPWIGSWKCLLVLDRKIKKGTELKLDPSKVSGRSNPILPLIKMSQPLTDRGKIEYQSNLLQFSIT